jgi:hypothetical protein
MSENVSRQILDDYKKANAILFTQMVMTFILFVYESSHSKNIFSLFFIFKILFFVILYRFYFKSQKNRDYAFWGITFIIFLYLVQLLLHYTFIDYNAIVLYLTFVSMAFLGICIYVMSSPLFFPRVQWWEYDFRFRGDIKTKVSLNDTQVDGRLSDLRREAACIEMFELFEPGADVVLELSKHEEPFKLTGTIVTIKRTVPGRPFRYGVKLKTENSETRKEYERLKEVWDSSKKVKIRKKFDS